MLKGAKAKAPKGAKALACALVLPLCVVLLWWALSALKLVNPYLMPSPRKVLGAAKGLVLSGALLRHLGISLYRVISGFALAVCIALPGALVFYCVPPVKNLFRGIFEFVRATPPLALIPLLILWMGIGEESKRAVIVLASFFPVFMNALSGFESIDGRWLELSASLELSFRRRLRWILFPAALPQLVTGLRLGFGYSWRALLGAELIASASGLGYLITDAQEMARVDVVFVGILCIGTLGLVFDKLLRLAAGRFSPADGSGPSAEERNWNA
jgi:NitT/TauT family transport system permease protein/sulfonate transport system permease protein